MTCRVAIVACVLVALQTPTAAAQGSDELTLTSTAPLTLGTDLIVTAAGGVARASFGVVDLTARFEGVRGTLTLVEYEAYVGGGPVPVIVQDPAVRYQNVTLDAGDILLRADAEPLWLRVVAEPDAILAVHGSTHAPGKPINASSDHSVAVGPRVPWEARDLDVTAREGWGFVGADHSAIEARPSFPPLASPRLDVSGRSRLQIHGGNASFVDANGDPHQVRLGNWTQAESPSVAGLPGVRRETFRYILLDADIERADVPLQGTWFVSAPVLTWDAEGSFAWERASGSARIDGRMTRFENAEVVAEGRLHVRPSPSDALGLAVVYHGTGDLRTLSVEGAPIASPTSQAPQAAAGLSILALLLLLAQGAREAITRTAYLLYTRISAAEALIHPQRAKIYREIVTTPGIHLRELHRRAGGGWGIFRAHLHLLRALGYVRSAREGRNLLLFAAGAALPAPTDRLHATARGILGAIPTGGATTLAELRDRLGLSRQLIAHHVARLERQGLLRSERGPHGERVITSVPAESVRA